MSSVANVTVKEERHDEAEIRELAAKMLEAHKQQNAKTAAAQQVAAASRAAAAAAAAAAANNHNITAAVSAANNNAHQINPNSIPPTVTANGSQQTNIMNYLTRKPNTAASVTIEPAASNNSRNSSSSATSAHQHQHGTNTAATNNSNNKTGNASSPMGSNGADGTGSDDKKPCDEESQKGHFGWAMFGKIFIPYILRQSEKYCAVRIIELRLLNKYLHYLHQDIYSCTCVRSYYITEAESRLLNEINHKHCDSQFGRDMFTLKDLVVRLSDANKFYQFLDVCYKKLIMGSTGPSDKCGFIRINKESVVPYTVRDTEKFVPLFYFEGETDNLKLKADYLNGWDLSYLKFCCKVQGIRNELFASDQVAVISLIDIKSYFPTGTEFEDYWPSKVVESQLLIGPKTPITNQVQWTRQPTAPPPKMASTTVAGTTISAVGGPVSMPVGMGGPMVMGGGSSAMAAGQSMGGGASSSSTSSSSVVKANPQQRSKQSSGGGGGNSASHNAMGYGSSAVAAAAMQHTVAAMTQQQQQQQRSLQAQQVAAAAAAAAAAASMGSSSNPTITAALQAVLAAGGGAWPGMPSMTQQNAMMLTAQAQAQVRIPQPCIDRYKFETLRTISKTYTT